MSKYMYVDSDGSVVFGDGTNIGLGPAYMLATSAGGNAGFTANRDTSTQFASFDLLEGGSTSTGWSIQMQEGDSNLSIVDRVNSNNIIYIIQGGPVKINSNLAVNGNISASSFTGTIDNALTASIANNAISASFAKSSSWAPSNGTTLITGSTYQITSSYSISSSFATNSQTSSQGLRAWGYLKYSGSLTQTTYNCSVTRISLGKYGISFTNPTFIPTSNYSVVITAVSGSSTGSIPCIGYITDQSNTNFTAAFKNMDVGFPSADFTAASFHVASY